MARVISLLRHIPKLESYLAFSERSGLTALILRICGFFSWFAVVVVIWLYTNLPWWALLLAGIATFAALSFGIERVLAALVHLRSLSGVRPINREELATKALELSRSVATLHAEFEMRKREAWNKDCEAVRQGAGFFERTHMSQVEREISERFSFLYEADVSYVIHTTAKLIPLHENFRWQFNGNRGYSTDGLADALAWMASELRHPQPALGFTEDDKLRADLRRQHIELPK